MDGVTKSTGQDYNDHFVDWTFRESPRQNSSSHLSPSVGKINTGLKCLSKTTSARKHRTSPQKAHEVYENLDEKRSAANIMERKRMERLNVALDRLRNRIPAAGENSKRCSKIKTLKLAIEYIHDLQKLLTMEETGSWNRRHFASNHQHHGEMYRGTDSIQPLLYNVPTTYTSS
ncbi:protein atonal homolog 7-like isoform X1 [Varroa jacobsoni]|uniref:protein atonal homolog 7-like isoform X1 n=1 Tax=Varroa jacobsoni TaxID=62625 RepID=UPI000BF29B11|nr:protein atonal homolog 7-like isoform X1 [Varroa jacobsoni]